jgi:hypothetical protein
MVPTFPVAVYQFFELIGLFASAHSSTGWMTSNDWTPMTDEEFKEYNNRVVKNKPSWVS